MIKPLRAITLPFNTHSNPRQRPYWHCIVITLTLIISNLGKTYAADPATTFFGVELNTRFQAPACGRGEDTMTQRVCYDRNLSHSLSEGVMRYHVFYPSSSSTPWARGEMSVTTIQGVIEAILVNTWGIEAQVTALKMLEAKYGPPIRSHSEKIKALRARLPSKFADWTFKTHEVQFLGTTNAVDWGSITLSTPRYQQWLQTQTQNQITRPPQTR